MSRILKIVCLALFLFSFRASVSNAQIVACPEYVPTISTCPSGCHVNTAGVANGQTLHSPCYVNNGDTKPCPSPCNGEYVFTAVPYGVCLGLDGCESGLMQRGRQLIHEGEFMKVYAPDCRGDMRVLIATKETSKPKISFANVQGGR